MLPTSLLLSSLIPLSCAHFALNFPPSRGSDDENQAVFPCGRHAQTQNRTAVSLTSLPLSLDLGHTENLITVALAIGNDVGDSFNTIIIPTVQEYGPGNFCWASTPLPANLGITEGTNATVQVITNSHDGGGLYNCADITFTSTAPEQPSSCRNGTGVSATPLVANQYVFANESSGHAEGHGSGSATSSGASGAGSATASEAAASATQSGGAAAGAAGAGMLTVGWGVLGAGTLGFVALM